jgi:hypothetical protein
VQTLSAAFVMSVLKYHLKEKIVESKPKLGTKVNTKKGCRINGPASGIVVGYGRWRDYDAVKVRKDVDGRVSLFLMKNLYVI